MNSWIKIMFCGWFLSVLDVELTLRKRSCKAAGSGHAYGSMLISACFPVSGGRMAGILTHWKDHFSSISKKLPDWLIGPCFRNEFCSFKNSAGVCDFFQWPTLPLDGVSWEGMWPFNKWIPELSQGMQFALIIQWFFSGQFIKEGWFFRGGRTSGPWRIKASTKCQHWCRSNVSWSDILHFVRPSLVPITIKIVHMIFFAMDGKCPMFCRIW